MLPFGGAYKSAQIQNPLLSSSNPPANPDAHLRRRQVHDARNPGMLTGAASILCRALPAAPGECRAQAGQVLGTGAVGNDHHRARKPCLGDLQVIRPEAVSNDDYRARQRLLGHLQTGKVAATDGHACQAPRRAVDRVKASSIPQLCSLTSDCRSLCTHHAQCDAIAVKQVSSQGCLRQGFSCLKHLAMPLLSN